MRKCVSRREERRMRRDSCNNRVVNRYSAEREVRWGEHHRCGRGLTGFSLCAEMN